MLWCQAEITRRVIFAVLAILIYNSSYIHPQRYQWPCTVKLPSLRKIGSLPTRRLRFDSSHSAASQELPYRLQTAWEKTLQDALYSCSSIGHHNIIDKFFYPTPSLCETCVNRVRLWANLTISDFSVLGRLFIHHLCGVMTKGKMSFKKKLKVHNVVCWWKIKWKEKVAEISTWSTRILAVLRGLWDKANSRYWRKFTSCGL